ncbi:hypothetical protein NE237_028107 [Protea cynaroides]|uniref:Uncharacterized protein n=1 Tax=Protea cynaroides TaxID=273540 RepID=A0A9Q0JUU3_9MAGN|nr:hypothetical protein NE237_028107 [Protea cynaroides]
MASSTMFSTMAPSSSIREHHTQIQLIPAPSYQCFRGLRTMKPTVVSLFIQTKKKKLMKRGIRVGTELNLPAVISMSTGLSILIAPQDRFFILQLIECECNEALPYQNKMTHFEARRQQANDLLKSNDPVGLNTIYVLMCKFIYSIRRLKYLSGLRNEIPFLGLFYKIEIIRETVSKEMKR